MGRSAPLRTVATILVVVPLASTTPMGSALAESPAPVAVDQGPEWTPAKRDKFYSLDQGSRIMPLRWIMALKLPDGSPFMADDLRRYGYLPNAASPTMLPVGFTSAGPPGIEMIGMTCAACHTRQIEVDGVAYRIDGGPAIVDFQTLLSDLDTAVDTVLDDATAFANFARAVLGSTHAPAKETALRQALSDWHYRYHTLMSKALPQDNPWGPGRVDAIGMIFNRLTGLDLGPPPSFIIESNIRTADAPVRYPFLWNAAKQDKTQWPGIADNDGDVLGMIRNIAQVFGTFGEFHPKKDSTVPHLGVDYMANNSMNVDGLDTLETLMSDIGPPRWPWALDEVLAEKGEDVYRTECDKCHRAEPGSEPWKTPITPIEQVNTDRRELNLIELTADTGELEGAQINGFIGPLQKVDSAFEILKISAIGTYIQTHPTFKFLDDDPKLISTFRTEMPDYVPGYEARVLHGVWAAAPYLHNGSVPTLTELLKPACERTASFKIGSAYDPVAVGLAAEQTQFGAIMRTTDCSDRESGNSRCGHEYGTTLGEKEKRALLEYLKKL